MKDKNYYMVKEAVSIITALGSLLRRLEYLLSQLSDETEPKK